LFLKFDSQWPIQLNGIISEDEFRKSIDKINDAFVPIQRHPKYDLAICLFLTVLGVICAIIGGIKQINGKPEFCYLNCNDIVKTLKEFWQ